MLKNYLCSRPLGERDIEFLHKKCLSCAFGAKNYIYTNIQTLNIQRGQDTHLRNWSRGPLVWYYKIIHL